MRVLLVGPDFEENLSIRYLSASLLRAGHDAELATFNSMVDTDAVANAAKETGIVGLSMCFQARAKEFLHLARQIKSHDPRKLIVAGGHYASCAAGPLLTNHPEIDLIAIHEGERTMVEIANAIPHLEELLPEIPGLAYRNRAGQFLFTRPRPMLDDLDALPFPDRRGAIHLIAGVPTNFLMGSRGCYGNCAYCCITTLHELAPGKRFRQRDVGNIADEMAVLYHERGTRQFVFHDDNFFVPSAAMNHARLTAFEKALKSRGIERIALVIKCRPADANLELLRRLKGLGLVRVFLGVESATERGLSALRRPQSVKESVHALEACAELNISAQFTLMTFHPDATLDTLRSDARFMRRFSGNPLNFCRAEIYAGTPLERTMIRLGRARGDYLARVYSLSDPIADLTCNRSLDLFEARCWSGGSLMQNAIGLDHTAAVAKRFFPGPRQEAVCERAAAWLRAVNLDTIDLLEEVIELSASPAGAKNAGLLRALLSIREREAAARQRFLLDGSNLRADLEALRFPNPTKQFIALPGTRLRLARQVAAAVLAIGIPATAGCHQAAGPEVPTPPQVTPGGQENLLCSLAGTVTDSSGAAVAKATITVTNVDTAIARTLATDEAGKYAASDLPAGRYTVKVQVPGFKAVEKTGIVLHAGDHESADLVLTVNSWPGCCEYAAVPLKVVEEDLATKKKPFDYYVGQAKDHNTFQGIATLVYGNSKMWVQIFEANRNVIPQPGFIPDGTMIVIPKRKRGIPKLQSRVLPAYPPSARHEHVWGDVVLDVTLKDDGTVEKVDVIDGPAPLVEVTVSAVKQWRYASPSAKNNRTEFVLAVSFSKGGKVY